MALGLLRALHEAGRTPPSAVSVVGFDDCPEAAYFIPPLTTIRQDFLEVGRRALNLMLEEIESGSRSAACAPGAAGAGRAAEHRLASAVGSHRRETAR